MSWQASSAVGFCILNRRNNFLIAPLANLGLEPRDVRVMTDKAKNPWNLPTKENIVRFPYDISFQPFYFL